MKIFISYHRVDSYFRKAIEKMLIVQEYLVYAVPEEKSFDGMTHEHIKTEIIKEMDNCDVVLCLVGEQTYTRPHVDHEIHAALKGGTKDRKGIVAVMLETRKDGKKKIDDNTFPTKLQQNKKYIVVKQYSEFPQILKSAVNEALIKAKDIKLQVDHTNPCMPLRAGKYYDNN